MNRVLIIIPTASYRAHDFITAAAGLNIEVIIGSEHRQALSSLLPDLSLVLNLQKPESSLKKIKKIAHCRGHLCCARFFRTASAIIIIDRARYSAQGFCNN